MTNPEDAGYARLEWADDGQGGETPARLVIDLANDPCGTAALKAYRALIVSREPELAGDIQRAIDVIRSVGDAAKHKNPAHAAHTRADSTPAPDAPEPGEEGHAGNDGAGSPDLKAREDAAAAQVAASRDDGPENPEAPPPLIDDGQPPAPTTDDLGPEENGDPDAPTPALPFEGDDSDSAQKGDAEDAQNDDATDADPSTSNGSASS